MSDGSKSKPQRDSSVANYVQHTSQLWFKFLGERLAREQRGNEGERQEESSKKHKHVHTSPQDLAIRISVTLLS